MSEEKLYAERDAMELDKAGDYYCRHVVAMTHEGLHSKSDIAAELGYRDMLIDQLEFLRETTIKFMGELGDLLGVNPDNESIFGAVEETKQRLAAYEAAAKEPVAWMWERATEISDSNGRYSGFEWLASRRKPNIPETDRSRRNLTPLYAAPPLQQPAPATGEYGDAYQGAREDLAIWKRRALEAEEKLRQPAPADKRVDDLVMLTKMLVRKLKKARPDSKLPIQAMDYLSRNGLISAADCLRSEEPTNDERIMEIEGVGSLKVLVASEIADFCAGLAAPGEPETPQEIQAQLLERILPLLDAEQPTEPAQPVPDSVRVDAWRKVKSERAAWEWSVSDAFIFKLGWDAREALATGDKAVSDD